MHQEEVIAIFDQQAASYDEQWSRLAPINNALHLITSAVLRQLPPSAHLLCVGTGTGAEIFYLAEKFPLWRFTAVEPSTRMMQVFREKAEARGILSRCTLHTGYLDSLPPGEPFDGATAFLVSQFILDREVRSGFFGEIASRLAPHGILVSSDLAGELANCQSLLEVWFRLMGDGGLSAEKLEKMREAYTNKVAVLPPCEIQNIMMRGGFGDPTLFFQVGMIHAWYASVKAN